MHAQNQLVWAVAFFLGVSASVVGAADISHVVHGKLLFEKEWTPGPTPNGGDGLGPVFNAASCAACHNQGGIGGAGGNEHNVLVVGIEAMTADRIRRGDPSPQDILANLHPDLKHGGAMVATKSTNATYAAYLNSLAAGLADSSTAAGSGQDAAADADDGERLTDDSYARDSAARQQASTSRIVDETTKSPADVARSPTISARYHVALQDGTMAIDLRINRRSTPALFGYGLIDQIPPKLIENVAVAQSKHPEISGRPSQTESGRIGKFGLRATMPTLLEFVDSACAMEMGLQTQDTDQAPDPQRPNYKLTGYDISRDDVRAMTRYIAALPAPTRQLPLDSAGREAVRQGEQLFASIGCSTCHVQDMGPAKGLYSDLLLHDMGNRLSDYAPAYPYVKKIDAIWDATYRLQTTTETVSETLDTITRPMPQYYGATIPPGTYTNTTRTTGGSSQTSGGYLGRALAGGFSYRSSEFPPRLIFIPVGEHEEHLDLGTTESKSKSTRTNSYGEFQEEKHQRSRKELYKSGTLYVKKTIEPTRVRNEWRTAPLWGLRDSAPYMHDGRAETVLQAIALHAGESAGTRDRFLSLSLEQQNAILAFLDTLIAPPANNLTTLAAR